MNINEFNFNSISSDDTLFDFDHIVNKIRKSKDIGNHKFLEKVREHFQKKFPHMNGVEQSVVVASFMVLEMDYKKFIETMDILNAKMSINVIL